MLHASPATARATPTPSTILGLALVVLLGGALRLWGIDAGAPYRMGADEPVVLDVVLRMVQTGDFHPNFFDYGSLMFYLHTGVAALTFLTGAMDGRWTHLGAIWQGDLLLAGRTLTALLGTLTIGVVFAIGLRWGRTVGLTAALVMAVLPPHVRESHFMLTDIPLTLFVALALLQSLRAAEAGTLSALALAGVAVGMAMATKYTGVLALIMAWLAALALPPGRRAVGAGTAAASAGVAFLVFAPYTVLDLPAFLNGMAALMQTYNANRPVSEAASVYLGHLRNWFAWPGILPLQFGYLALILAATGALSSWTGSRDGLTRVRAALLTIFPLLYLWFVSSQSLLYGRYLLPIAPVLCVMLAIALPVVASWLRRRVPALRSIALPMIVVLVVGMPLATAITWNRGHARTTTAEQAAGWLVAHAPSGSHVVLEESTLQMPPSLVSLRTANLLDRTIDEYRASGVTYLVATSRRSNAYYADPVAHQHQLAAYQAMMTLAQPVATFAPTAEHPGPTITVLYIRP